MDLLAMSVLGSRPASQADGGLWRAPHSGQTTELREFPGRPHTDPPRVLVTHQVNITALTEVFPGSEEMIVIPPAAHGEDRGLGQLDPGR